MNRALVLVVILLMPVAIITTPNSDDKSSSLDMENKMSYDLLVDNNAEENDSDAIQVSLSYNQDKSDIFTMDLEDYIIGVVAGEMPASFNLEALKAQAVASRTYALYKMDAVKDYVLSTTINDQVYLSVDDMKEKWGTDFDYYYNRVKEAVEATKGEVLTYNGEIASTYYFAISNGYTDDAQVVFNEDKDYLVSVESAWDKNFQSYSSLYTINKNDFCSKLGLTCGDITISNVVRASNNYVREITINNKTFTGIEVFKKLNLKSTDFTINVDANNVLIQTYGFGHGIGMSQYGAQGMSSEGYKYQDILKYYYQNTEITKL